MNKKNHLPKLIIPSLLMAIYFFTLAHTIAEPEEPYSRILQSASISLQKEVQVMVLSPEQSQSPADQELVLVVELDRFSRVYRLADFSPTQTVFQTRLGDTDVVVFVDGQNQNALAYRAEVQGQPVEFSLQGNEIRDASGSTWSMEGTGLSGPNADVQLETVATFFTTWGTWLAAHPQATLSIP